MTLSSLEDLIVSDVKCYYCGHTSGQIVSRRGSNAGRFVPRPGYKGPDVKAGSKIRCERCQGPVFLEDATPMARAEGALARTLRIKAAQARKSQGDSKAA